MSDPDRGGTPRARAGLWWAAALAAVLAAVLAVPAPAAAAQNRPTLSFSSYETSLVAGEKATVHEGRSVPRWVEVSIDISPPMTERAHVLIEVDTDLSTATPDEDFTWPRARTLSLRPGQSRATTMFGPTADEKAEGEEVVVLRMVAVEHAPYTIDDDKNTQRITILDSSRPPASSADPDRGLKISHYNLPVIEGSSAAYTVALASQPSHQVTVTPLVRTNSDGNDAITITPRSRTFSPQNWHIAQQFTVTVPPGDYDTDTHTLLIDHTADSLDDDYNSAVWFNGPGLHQYLRVTINEPRPQQPLGPAPQEPPDDTPQDPANPWLLISGGPPQPNEDQPSTDPEPTPDDHSDLIARMYGWRNNDPQWSSVKAHTDRWDRALLAFGETVADASITPMTAAEAQALADQSWGTRWVPVAAALRQIEAAAQPQNRAPTVSSAIADAVIVNETGTRRVSLSGVFSDADSDALTITAASSSEAVATVSVALDQSSLTVNAQARGAATITVTADDGSGGTVSDVFTVTVKAAPRVASEPAGVSGLTEGSARDLSLSGVFSDADDDALSVSAASDDQTVATVTVASDGSALTVAGVAAGEATITVTAQDSDGNRASVLLDVTVVAPQPVVQQQPQNQPPQQQVVTPQNQAPTVASAIADATITNQSGRERVSLAGVFSDADDDALTITASSSDEAVATVSVAADYAGLTVSASSRGSATVTVTADDGNGGTVSDVFTVTVKAAPVVASALADLSLEQGGTHEVSLAGVFSDADDDALTFTASSSDAAVDADALGGTLTIVGVSAGSATVTVTAEDSDGNRASETFEVSVAAPQSGPDAGTPDIVDRYDANSDGSIEKSEYRRALNDYNAGTITYDEMLAVTIAMFRG